MEGFKDFFREQEVIQLYLNNREKRIAEISAETGESAGEIYRILHSNGISPNRLGANHQSVFDFARSGLSVQQIAELTGYTPRNVRYILHKMTEDYSDTTSN
jgi:DNA-binding NarL/FixJ family response regulator